MTIDMVGMPVLKFFIDESVIKMQSSRYKIDSGGISKHKWYTKISHKS
jgi:hypothetical protein